MSKQCTLLTMLLLAVNSASAADPLHVRIDRAIDARAGGDVAEPSSDSEFLRRIHLDLVGVIPTAAETRTFLADKDPNKRTKLIDRLLAHPDHARRMQQVVSVWLLERRGGGVVSNRDWDEFVRMSFAKTNPGISSSVSCSLPMAAMRRPERAFASFSTEAEITPTR